MIDTKHIFSKSIGLFFVLLTANAFGAATLPMTCGELIPDPAPFVSYLETVARLKADTNQRLTKQIFVVMAYRAKLARTLPRLGKDNPADELIMKMFCFYRLNKEPLRVIPGDDEQVEAYLNTGLPELEKKLVELLAEAEAERVRQQRYEKKLEKNQRIVERLRREAEVSADREFEKLANTANRKANKP